MKKILSKLIKWLSIAIITLLACVVLVMLVLQIPYVQNILVHKATDALSQSLNTEVSVGKVSIDFLSNIHLNDVLIRDYKKDTMIFVQDFNNHHSIAFLDQTLNEEKVSISGMKFYLDNTVTDSVFNLTHTFSKNKVKDNTTKTKNSKKTDLSFLKFGNVTISNSIFRLKDKFNHQTLAFQIDKLNVNAEKLVIPDSPLRVNSIEILNPKASLIKHNRPIEPLDLKAEYLHVPLVVNINKLILSNASFRVIDEMSVHIPHAKNVLSFQDLDVQSLTLEAEDVKLRKPSIAGHVLKLEAKEKSGLEIEKLKADFFLNSQRTEAKNLEFKTGNSYLNGYLRFDYKHMREYLKFAAWVRVTANMKKSNLSFKDMAYFSPALSPWSHLDFKFNTIAHGTMNDLMLTHLNASLNKDRLKAIGDIRVMDLFSGKGLYTIANLKQASFDKNDIGFVFQNKALPKEMDRLGRINYVGKFVGNPLKFNLTGHLNSAQGGARLHEASFDFTDKNLPKYKGRFELENLKLENIIGENNPMTDITANLEIKGQGFDIQSLNSYIKGKIKHISIKGSSYNDVDVDGNIKDKIFTGKLHSNDPSLNIAANGKISMQTENPNIELSLELRDVDLKKLGLTKKQLLLNTNVLAIGRGKTIDEMLGTLLLKDMYILDGSQNRKRYNFSTMTLEKDIFEEGDQYININSEEIDASIVGKYKVSDLPALLKEYLISYVAIDAVRENQIYSQTYFNMGLKIKNIRSYTKLFYEDLKNIESGNIKMRFDGFSNKLSINGQLSQTEFKQFKVPHVVISNESTNSSFTANINFDSVFFQDKLAITPMKTEFNYMKEGLKMSVELLNRSDDKFVDFNTLIRKKGEDIQFNILPFTSYFGRKVWTLNPDNEITMNSSKGTLSVRDFELFKDKQQISFSNKNEDIKSINVKFNDVKLEELISGFMPILKAFKGEMNGQVDIANVMMNPTPVANLDISNIEYNNEKYGKLSLKSDFNNSILNSTAILDGNKIKMKANGVFDVDKDFLDVNAKISKFDLDILNTYLKDLIYDMDGQISSDIHLFGKIDELKTEGEVYIDSMKTGIANIFTKYSTKNQKITILSDKFVLKDFLFKDEEGNNGIANGFIAHENLRKFDLYIDAKSPKLLCMNTNSTNNASFYGKVYADIEYLRFRGIIGERLTMTAKGENLDNSVLTIAFASNQNTEQYGFYEFAKKDKDYSISQSPKLKKRIGGVNFDFDFEVNSGGTLYVILDPTVDDYIKCTGNGNIKFMMSPESDMKLDGNYVIESGRYLFTYQNLVQRTWYLEKGGTMSFLGSPYDSKIDISAKTTTRASAQELINSYYVNSDNPSIQSAAKTLVKAILTINLKDKMTQPLISYNIDVEQNNQEVISAFDLIKTSTKNNESELNKQVLGLLLYQRFFPPSFTTDNASQNNVRTDVVNAAIDILSSKVSGMVTDWVQSTWKGVNVDFKAKSYQLTDKATNSNDSRNELKLAISQKLFNDRFIFNIGTNYDFGRNQFNNTNTAFFGGDVDIEYRFPPTGNIRGKIYSTLSNDALTSLYINKTGMGISFNKEFDKFNEIFKKKEKK